jgi:hypothetical protein
MIINAVALGSITVGYSNILTPVVFSRVDTGRRFRLPAAAHRLLRMPDFASCFFCLIESWKEKPVFRRGLDCFHVINKNGIREACTCDRSEHLYFQVLPLVTRVALHQTGVARMSELFAE